MHDPDDLLRIWAEVAHRGAHGYSRHSPIARLKDAPPTQAPLGCRLPGGVDVPGLRPYYRVDRVLRRLGDLHRLIAALETGLIRPTGQPTKTQTHRAAVAGITARQYAYRLREIRLALAD